MGLTSDPSDPRLTRGADPPVPVSAIWLRKATLRNGGRLEVLAQVDGQWRIVVDEVADDGPISHIVAPCGIREAPPDDLEER